MNYPGDICLNYCISIEIKVFNLAVGSFHQKVECMDPENISFHGNNYSLYPLHNENIRSKTVLKAY